jgi:hypothetical protein
MKRIVTLCLCVIGCGGSTTHIGNFGIGGGRAVADGGGTGGGSSSSGGGNASGGSGATGGGDAGGSGATCPASPLPLATDAMLDPTFATVYTAYQLGPVPGVPDPLGGCVIRRADTDTLWIAGGSEGAGGALYTIKLRRDACHHIIGFDGTATKVADTPYIDANVVEATADTLLYTQWPQNKVSTIRVTATSPDVTVDLSALGYPDSPGGIGFVPPPLATAGQLRTVTWPAGHWFHLAYTVDAGTWSFPAAMEASSSASPLPNNPGGFAYVPAGSPLFPNQSVIVSQWSTMGPSADRVVVYEVDANGDPIESSQKDFFMKFPRPWGAYFEPVTGDYLFLTWGAGMDRIYLVEGFAAPPPPPMLGLREPLQRPHPAHCGRIASAACTSTSHPAPHRRRRG